VNAAAVNTRWCGDITYVPTWEGWLYLATVIDIASRRVVGFALAEHLRTELVADALANAVAARDPAPGVIFHSDKGCQLGFKGSSQHRLLLTGSTVARRGPRRGFSSRGSCGVGC
jgi:transposase InsO family protein